jgi:hypothetical protein
MNAHVLRISPECSVTVNGEWFLTLFLLEMKGLDPVPAVNDRALGPVLAGDNRALHCKSGPHKNRIWKSNRKRYNHIMGI